MSGKGFGTNHGRIVWLMLALFLLTAVFLKGPDLAANLWHNVGWVQWAQTAEANAHQWWQQGAGYFPEDVAMWRALGFARAARADEADAMAAWQQVPGIADEFVRWSREAGRQGQLEAQATWLQRAQEVAPDSAVVWYYWGLFQAEQGDAEAALTAFQMASASEGASGLKSSLDLHIGLLLAADGRDQADDQWVSLWMAAIEADQFAQAWERVETHYQLGEVYYQNGRYAEAIDQFENTLALEPAHYRGTVRLAEATWQETQNWQAARNLLAEAMVLRPENKWAHKVLANILVEAGQLDEAAEIYRSVLAIDAADQTAIDFLTQHPQR